MAASGSLARSNLPFPAELRTKILIELLVKSISNPSNPYIFVPTFKKRPQISSYTTEIQPLIRAFKSLSLVSKIIREEVLDIFFGENEWKFSLDIFNRELTFSAERWEEDIISRMRKITLHLCGEPSSHRNQQDPHFLSKNLECFVDVLNKGNYGFKMFTVRWENRYSAAARYNRQGFLVNMRGIDRLQGSERLEDGRRAQEVFREEWFQEEVEVLGPLRDVREVKHPRVVGSVSDQWALYLEDCMSKEMGVSMVSEFERDFGFKDRINGGRDESSGTPGRWYTGLQAPDYYTYRT